MQTAAETPLGQLAGDSARARIVENTTEIRRTLKNASIGNPLASEPDAERLVTRLMAKNLMTREEAEATAIGIRAYSKMSESDRVEMLRSAGKPGGAEAIWGRTIDFVGVAFLQRGVAAARSVARVAFRTGRGWGSGFMVSEGLFLTNCHVVPDEKAARDLCIEFDYELDVRDSPVGISRFALDPDAMFISDAVEGLDFTLVAVGPRLDGTRDLAYYGHCCLSDSPDKHAVGEVVNIVQHPAARYKEVVLRENRLVARATDALHYVADTEPGSSGSPVFNNQWQPVALHHWGAPFRNVIDEKGATVPREVNEGIRISRIVAKLRDGGPQLNAQQQARLQRTLAEWGSTVPVEHLYPHQSPVEERAPTRYRENRDGSITYIFPIEISVRAPLAEPPSPPTNSSTPPPSLTPVFAESSKRPSTDYGDRDGYEPGFIPGHVVPLPTLSDALRRLAARNLQAGGGDDPFELKYHHFSSVVNKRRQLPFFVACNIDGRRSKYINRQDGTISALDPANTDHGLMERLEYEGAEASEQWYEDSRLQPGAIANQEVYGGQVVAGYLDTRSMARTLRMFQRGHLVRRLDPAWGTNTEARLAELDTFHFTNCVPQVGFFNMGRGRRNVRGTGGGKLWRAVENLVLRNARNMKTRVSAFTGPIFDDPRDREFRTIRVPGRFFKVAVWADEDGLRSLAMIADQRPVFDVWPEALVSGKKSVESLRMEAFQDPDELERVDDFLTTIEAIEEATGLNFGAVVREGDVRRGLGDERPERFDDVPLAPRVSAGKSSGLGRQRRKTAPMEQAPRRRRVRKRRQ